MKHLYRYEIEYSSAEGDETRVILLRYPVIRETEHSYFIEPDLVHRMAKKQKRVNKTARNTYAYINPEKAREHFMRRTQKRIAWYKYWTKECEKALELIEPQGGFTSKQVSIKLHEHGFYVPSLNYYEWTGATELSKLTEPGWLEDSINVYTEEEIDKYFPKNVAVNENVVEFGIKPTDNDATKKAKVLVHLLKIGAIERIDAT